MSVRLIVRDNPSDEDRGGIAAPLSKFNSSSGYPPDPKPLAILLVDDDGNTIGGLYGKTIYDWVFVDLLVVPEHLRGSDIGTELMMEAERVAIERGCVGAWLTTFTFQARGFYEKLGYELFGELENSPDDNARLFLRKRLYRAQPPIAASASSSARRSARSS